MAKNNNKKIKIDFLKLTGIAPFHRTNKLSEGCLTKNIIFHRLAEKVFDTPELLKLLEAKINKWLEIERSEFTYMVAGYVYYFKEEFKTAEKYFIKAINLNPENLDNWFCLVFSLYHQEKKKYCLAGKVVFNFDYCMKKFKNSSVSLKALAEKLRDR